MAEIGHIDVNDLAKAITVHVSIPITGYKRLRIKMYVGKMLIRLGIRIIGMNVKIIEE